MRERTPATMKITGITVQPIKVDTGRPKSWLSQTLIANPMSVYEDYKPQRELWTAAWGPDLLVRIQTDEDLEGIGATVPAGAKPIIEAHFRNLLVGQNPFDVEKLWDQMFRASLPYGRKGLAIMAISAVDIALWDIVGKATGQPVYKLIGGAVKEALPVYSTGNDVEYFKELGFRGFKLAMPHGPADGWDGIKKNVELVEWARDIVGQDSDLMLDCYMAWNVDFTLRMSREVERLGVRWIEECLPPDDYEGYAEITAKSRVPVATGEHEYTRWGFKELIARRCCHILQPDLNWVGGISEAKKIAAMASAWGVDVIPHAGGLQPWGVHFMISSVNTPQAEWVVVGNKGEKDAARTMTPWLRNTPVPVDGRIRPNEEPGFGATLDESWLEA
jgi:L-rhamnonate dehydratase